MDPFTIALGALKFGLEAVSMAQKSGFIGGSTDFAPYLDDARALWSRFEALVGTFANAAEFDKINALSPQQKYDFIYGEILLEGMDKKDARIRAEMGLA